MPKPFSKGFGIFLFCIGSGLFHTLRIIFPDAVRQADRNLSSPEIFPESAGICQINQINYGIPRLVSSSENFIPTAAKIVILFCIGRVW